MRWWPLAFLALLPGLGGCAEPAPHVAPPAACPATQAALVQQVAPVVWPALTPEEARSSFGPVPRVVAAVRPGQSVEAVASFTAAAGQVAVAYDGPLGTLDQAPGNWAMQAVAKYPENVTLELVGTPMASVVAYTLVINVYGCPTA